MSELNSVQKFYKDKTIFITGASGFMGKVLLEKLLYSCSELHEIVILMRPKRGKSEIERVADFVNIPVSFNETKTSTTVTRCKQERNV
jgi:alcohol-forming fatty acyl-CoA reductase